MNDLQSVWTVAMAALEDNTTNITTDRNLYLDYCSVSVVTR